ncbi:fibronectin type III domain-containing protein [Aestuariibacter halophilus]|uniref:Fibronectin type III domain-containing protein n=1 Tax=Fluctibacter halophilus TaxID=226011 RepID=A0ABS8G7U5_9ALTE|nr:fibronectin type III domain-containing protein [Aestuariibacter halophilus]MCC2616161.1 fibronectin type III domain-containing protein [Aestuariibacter halophilus]
MKSFKHARLALLVGCMGVSASNLVFANQGNGAPASLPPQALENMPEGRLKQNLSKLPPRIQEHVLSKLSSLGIPAIDLLLMDVDDSGELFYIEEGLVEPIDASADTAEATLPPVDVFRLHSNPGSSNTIFLDFNGGLISQRAWGGGASYDAEPYDLDGNPFDFNATERARIHEIWTRIADDFAAFDVNVTTEAPSSFGPNTGWLLFTKDTDANGNAMPSQGAGGVAYVGVWGRSNYTYYQPALVYYNRLGSGASTYMAEAGSHEMGHNFGLSHDGTSTVSYFRGLGADNEPSSWAPIMGVGYAKNVTQWSRGEYPDANQLQDDIAIITGKLGDSADSEGTSATPVALVLDANGQFSASNRELDPGNTLTDNKGTVQISDSDWFQFSAGSGPAEFRATPAWDAFTRSTRRGANLDIGLRLYDASGALIAEATDDYETNVVLSTTLAQGLYVLEVFGSEGIYASDYGSQGHYYLNGQVTVGVADTTPPDPNPMSFAQLPVATGPYDITMTAVTAVDDQGGTVSYHFSCSADGQGCVDSSWQSSATYTASNLQPQTEYCYAVSARDISGNVTVASAAACATTDAAPPPVTPPAAPQNLQVVDGQDGTASLSWTDASDNETGFEVEREKQHKNGRWQSLQVVAVLDAETQSYVDLSGEGSFRYRVRAVNTSGGSAWTPWQQVTVTAADGGGNDKPCRGKKCAG